MIDTPMHFEDAIGFLLNKRPNPQEWVSTDWAAEKPAVRVRSFFSSQVESARFLDRAQGLIFDYMAKVREDVGNGKSALRVGGREDFVMLMREFMIREGMAKSEEFKKVKQGDLTDIRSVARLRLIFDTNVRQAYGYGQWKQGMKPAVRRAFPASRFVRERPVAEPRPRHSAHEGEVRLKTDLNWWAKYQNDPAIGGFGVPWSPYGFHSGMGQEDVPRAEAKRLGLRIDREADGMAQPGLNDELQTSVRNMDAETKRKLLEELRGGPKPRDPEEVAREAAANARARARARKGLPPETPLTVADDGDKIRLMPFKQPELTGPSGEPIEVPDELAKRILEMTRDGRGITGFAGDIDPRLLASITERARAMAGESIENAALLSPDGQIIHEAIGSERVVSVPASMLHGSTLVHNHPSGTPLGIEDIENLIRHQMEAVWAVGGDWLYGASAGETPRSLADLRVRLAYLNEAIYAVLSDASKHRLLDASGTALESAHLHALWAELAREGFITYARILYGRA